MNASISDFATMLEAARWKADMLVTMHFGERMWLKALIENGRQIGITECCLEESPCERHSEPSDEMRLHREGAKEEDHG